MSSIDCIRLIHDVILEDLLVEDLYVAITDKRQKICHDSGNPVSLWARLVDGSNKAQLHLRDEKFLDWITSVAERGTEYVVTREGVEYIFSTFDPAR